MHKEQKVSCLGDNENKIIKKKQKRELIKETDKRN